MKDRWEVGWGAGKLIVKKYKASAYLNTRCFQNIFRCSFAQANVFVMSAVFNVPITVLEKCSMVLLRYKFIVLVAQKLCLRKS